LVAAAETSATSVSGHPAAFSRVRVSTLQSQPVQPQPPLLGPVLNRAAAYVERFAARVAGIVVAESYVQDVYPPLNRFGSLPRNARQQYTGPMHRELKSDLLLVRPVGADAWMQFRDVTEVDGHKLKDRNDRLEKLFLQPSKSTAAQSRKIMEESARYNIGEIERNINLPVLALVVLDRGMQPGFQFKIESTGDKFDLPKEPAFVPPADALVISFTETQLRTMVASPQGKNMPSRGYFWLEPSTSRVLMTEISVEDLSLKATIDVAYRPVEAIDIPLPVEMHERYQNKLNGTRVEGSATYSNFREFKVNVDEDIAPIGDDKKDK
jgi:hypothetical protein